MVDFVCRILVDDMKFETDMFTARIRPQMLSLFSGSVVAEPQRAMESGDGNKTEMHTQIMHISNRNVIQMRPHFLF